MRFNRQAPDAQTAIRLMAAAETLDCAVQVQATGVWEETRSKGNLFWPTRSPVRFGKTAGVAFVFIDGEWVAGKPTETGHFTLNCEVR